MNKSDKIREYFRKHPDADVAKVAAKFEAAKPMVYKLRKQVAETDAVNMGLAKQVWEASVEAYERETGTDVDETLDNRAQDYGKFKDGAELM